MADVRRAYFRRYKYLIKDRLAVGVEMIMPGDSFGTENIVTANIPNKKFELNEDEAPVNIAEYLNESILMEKLKIAERTGKSVSIGGRIYPIYKFNLSRLNKIYDVSERGLQ